MDDILSGRAFLGIRLDSQVNRHLGLYQRSVYDQFKGDGRSVHNLPRRLMALPIVDLGVHDEEAFEIVRMTIRRAIVGVKAFDVSLSGVGVTRRDPNVHYVSAQVGQGHDTLVSLRQKLAEKLCQYGFAVDDGQWSPHIPMTRIKGDLGSLGMPIWAETVSFSVQGLSIFGPTRHRSEVISHRMDIAFEDHSFDESDASDEAHIMRQIGEELDARIAQLNEAFATQRRRQKPKFDPSDGNRASLDDADDLNDDAEA